MYLFRGDVHFYHFCQRTWYCIKTVLTIIKRSVMRSLFVNELFWHTLHFLKNAKCAINRSLTNELKCILVSAA